MDAAYYATYLGSTYAKFFNLDLLTNFYAGGGDDELWGGDDTDRIILADGIEIAFGGMGADFKSADKNFFGLPKKIDRIHQDITMR
jgi:hypothetical protein